MPVFFFALSAPASILFLFFFDSPSSPRLAWRGLACGLFATARQQKGSGKNAFRGAAHGEKKQNKRNETYAQIHWKT